MIMVMRSALMINVKVGMDLTRSTCYRLADQMNTIRFDVTTLTESKRLHKDLLQSGLVSPD